MEKSFPTQPTENKELDNMLKGVMSATGVSKDKQEEVLNNPPLASSQPYQLDVWFEKDNSPFVDVIEMDGERFKVIQRRSRKPFARH